MLRSYWLPLLSSLLFELVELSLKHQLPYFFECWWDRVSLFSMYLIQLNRSKGTSAPRVFHVETIWKQSFLRRFNTWFVCRGLGEKKRNWWKLFSILKRKNIMHAINFTNLFKLNQLLIHWVYPESSPWKILEISHEQVYQQLIIHI